MAEVADQGACDTLTADPDSLTVGQVYETVRPESDTNLVDTDHSVTATLTDQFGEPASGVRLSSSRSTRTVLRLESNHMAL